MAHLDNRLYIAKYLPFYVISLHLQRLSAHNVELLSMWYRKNSPPYRPTSNSCNSSLNSHSHILPVNGAPIPVALALIYTISVIVLHL